MTEQPAFLSLARRLGNPIAERPGAIEVLELSELIRVFRSGPRRDRLLRAARGYVPSVVWMLLVPGKATSTAHGAASEPSPQ